MTLPKEFLEQLPQKTDQELYDMLGHPEDYLPEALIAAKGEVHKRNLPPEKVKQLEAATQTRQAVEAANADQRLSWTMRLLIFFLCSGIFGALLAVHYDNKGFKRKASDCWITMVVSFVFHALMGILLALE